MNGSADSVDATQAPQGRGKPSQQRQRILDAATRVLPARGVAGVRLRDVAQEAGVSIGALQHYFASRDELLRQTCQWASWQRVHEWTDTVDPALAPWERLQALFDHVFSDPRMEERSIRWLEFCTAAARDPELQQEMAAIYDEWRQPLREIIAEGVEKNVFSLRAPLDSIVDLITMMIDGSATATAISASNMSRSRMCRLLHETAGFALGVDFSPAERRGDAVPQEAVGTTRD